MADTPKTVIADSEDGTKQVTMLLGGLRRSFGVLASRLKDRIVAVAISEFGMAAADAASHADEVVDAHLSGNDKPEDLRPELELATRRAADFNARLTKATTDLLKAQSDLRKSQSDLQASEKENADLQRQLAAARHENEVLTAEAEAKNTPPEPGGGVSTPAGETPPAKTPAPQTDTGVAAEPATAGGEQGKT